MILFILIRLRWIAPGVSVITLALVIEMRFPIKTSDGSELPGDINDVFQNVLVIDMGRPYVNGRRIDEETWNIFKKIVNKRCMPCFPVHYPALYISLHRHKLTQRAVSTFHTIMKNVMNKGCPCHCHAK